MSFSLSNETPLSIMRHMNVSNYPGPTPSSKFWISDWLECLLQTLVINNLGPTICNRWAFIACNCIYNSYQFITTGKTPVDYQNPSGVSYWTSTQKGISSVSLESWMEYCCQYFFPIILETYMPYNSRTFQQLPPSDPLSMQSLIQKHTPLQPMNGTTSYWFTILKNIMSTYLAARDADGWKNTFTFNPSYNNNYNSSSYISGDNSELQNLNTLPLPTKWTPLKINGVTKNYVTPEWGAGSTDPNNVCNTGILSSADFQTLQANAQALFPSPAQWQKEISDLYNVVANLTDAQKMIFEYWAEGPSGVNSNGQNFTGSLCPPNAWFPFIDVVMRSNGMTMIDEIRFYTITALGMYESSINAWKLKRTNLQARPIQTVRQLLYNPSTSTNVQINQAWNLRTPGASQGSGAYWLPYENLDFVTPPFPDFCSGHATFGGFAARMFGYLLGKDTIELNNPVSNLEILGSLAPILAPNFNNTDTSLNTIAINSVFFYPGCSTIQPSPGFNGNLQAPLSAVILNYPTWNSMSIDNADSREYGGVHYNSSNKAGILLGTQIADKIWGLYQNL